MERLRRAPLAVLLLLGTFVALAAATGAGLAWQAAHRSAAPSVVIHFTDRDRITGTTLGGPVVAGAPAPGATFAELHGGLGSLAALRGKPVVVNFFGSWCVPCVRETPALQKAHTELGSKVTFLGLAVTDSQANASAFVQRSGVTYEVGRDPTGSIAESFDVVSYPSTLLLAADGTIVARHTGALTTASLLALVRSHLGITP